MFRPYKSLISIIRELILKALKTLNVDVAEDDIKVEETKSRIHGDFFTTVAFAIAKNLYRENFKANAVRLAEELAKKINEIKPDVISHVRAENGYINFFLDRGAFAKFVLEGLMKDREKFGKFTEESENIIIEHTSANPIHALHIGHARNAFIGDCLARIYKFVGNKVSRRFYINDCGKQVAMLILGLKALGKIPSNTKVDHFCGAVYSCIASIVELHKSLKNAIKNIDQLRATLRKINTNNHLYDSLIRNLVRDIALGHHEIAKRVKAITENSSEVLDNLIARLEVSTASIKNSFEILASIAAKWPAIYYNLSNGLKGNVPARISQIIRDYERQNENITKFVRETLNKVLDSLTETLDFLRIYFDAYDWESDLIWSGIVEDILRKLMERGYAYKDEKSNAIFLDARKILKDFPEMQEFFLDGSKDIKFEEIKNPVLVRKDGSTLYLLRDIAYAYYKLLFLKADKAISVIGIDQKLEQKYVVLALRSLGITNVLQRYKHVAYELVRLPGRRMSSRKGQYITLDEILWETIKRSYDEVEKRYKELGDMPKYALAKEIAIGAIKYALLSQIPTKVITYDWNRVLDFEQNSGPFIQYAHARAASILRKAFWKIPEDCNLSLLREPEEFELIYKISKFPEVLDEVIRTSRPDILAEYTNELAMLFNKFYQKCPVLSAEDAELGKARLLLVATFRSVIATAMKLMGITPLYRM
ncbi:MAG: arginine--tRNA ligase [Candidatus Korarchaeota archaeon]